MADIYVLFTSFTILFFNFSWYVNNNIDVFQSVDVYSNGWVNALDRQDIHKGSIHKSVGIAGRVNTIKARNIGSGIEVFVPTNIRERKASSFQLVIGI